MSLLELKETVLALPEKERHEFFLWVNQIESDYGDIPAEALSQLAAEIWDQDGVEGFDYAWKEYGVTREEIKAYQE